MGVKSWNDKVSNVRKVAATKRRTRTKEALQANSAPTFTLVAPAVDPRVGAQIDASGGKWNQSVKQVQITIERVSGSTVVASVTSIVEQNGLMRYTIPNNSEGQKLRIVAEATDNVGKGRKAIAKSQFDVVILPASLPLPLTPPVIAGSTDPSGDLTIQSYGTWQNATVPDDLSLIWQSDETDIPSSAGQVVLTKTSDNANHDLRLRLFSTAYPDVEIFSGAISITSPVGGPGFLPRARWGVTETSTDAAVGTRDVVYGNEWTAGGNTSALPLDPLYDYFMQVEAYAKAPWTPPAVNFAAMTAIEADGSGTSHKLSTYPIGTGIITRIYARQKANPAVYYLVTDPTDTITAPSGKVAPYGYVEVQGPPAPALSAPDFKGRVPVLSPAGPLEVGVTITMQDASADGYPDPAIGRRWYADATLRSGSNDQATYVTVAGDDGKTITGKNTATNSQGGPVTSNASNGVQVQAAPVSGTDFPEVPAAAITAARAIQLSDYSDDNNGFKNNGYNNGAQWVEAYAALAGGSAAGCDADVLEQIRRSLGADTCPGWAGGYGVQVHLAFATSAALVRRTPRLWNALTSADDGEQDKVYELMVAGLICSLTMTGSGNKASNFIGNKDWATGGNSNFCAAKPAVLLACRLFFGSVQAMKDIANNYDRAAHKARLTTLGLDNAVRAFCSTSVYTDTQVQNIVKNWQANYGGTTYTLDQLDAVLNYVLNKAYGKTIMSGVGGTAANDYIGPGVAGYTRAGHAWGLIETGASDLPNRGQIGMCEEFDSGDSGDPDTNTPANRSSGHYVTWMYRITVQILLLAMVEGTLNPGNSARASVIAKMKRGHTDWIYKCTKGYWSYDHGASAEHWTLSLAEGRYGGAYLHKILPLVFSYAENQ